MTTETSKVHRAPAIALIAAPLLSVFAMRHHPSTGSSGLAERLAEMAREAALGAFVHGGLIALMLLVLWGLLSFAGALGWSSNRVRLATLLYATGVVSMIGAATISGFIVTGLASHFASASTAEMESAVPVFRFCFEANHALAGLGTVGMSSGIFLWSWVLLGRRPRGAAWVRGVAVLGLVAGVAPVGALFWGALRLDVHGMLLVVVAQSLWTVLIGVWLLQYSRAPS